MISTLLTSIIGLWLLVLSARIIALRGVSFLKFFSFNNYGNEALNRAIRAQGNLIEYAPIFLILIFIAEYNGAHPHMLYLTGTIFLIARLMHGIAFGFMEYSPLLRVVGTLLTFLSILIISVHNIIEFL
tara:strand:+ start:200 stop:586 length:387 start_codon:yes stop_codon:yes gene_type:complete